ncbi:MAG TPA: transposase [Gammaproteobacteria bacterium]|jgi:REP element-mobilizing transposase RayT|nr:transposase [Gammaproteobacteria bacterium]
MQSKEITVPLAYFITFSCYGTWLHGGKETSVDRHHNIPETEFLPPNHARQTSAKNRMLETAYLLNQSQRQIVLNAIKEVCQYRRWILLAAHVRTNHVHLIVHAMLSPEIMMNTIKSYSSRQLNASKLDGRRVNRWTRHGSTRYLWREEDIEATIQYVIHEQGSPMATFENKMRSFEPCDY